MLFHWSSLEPGVSVFGQESEMLRYLLAVLKRCKRKYMNGYDTKE